MNIMKESFILSRNIVYDYKFLILSSDACKLYVYINADADEYGIVNVKPILYITRLPDTALSELIDANYINILDDESKIAYIRDWTVMNRNYDIRYLKPSPNLYYLSRVLPNIKVIVPLLNESNKDGKPVIYRTKDSCLAKDAIARWIEVLTKEGKYGDLAIIKSMNSDYTLQLEHDTNMEATDNTKQLTQQSPDGDSSPTQRAPDGDPSPTQRAPDGDPSPTQRAPDGDPPPTPRAPNGDSSPTQQAPEHKETKNEGNEKYKDNEKLMAISLLASIGITHKTKNLKRILENCTYQEIKEAFQTAKTRAGPDPDHVANAFITLTLGHQ